MSSIDKKVERMHKDKILRQVGRLISPLGFSRTRTTTFYAREQPMWIEFVHLHKFTFGPEFRAHLGIRVLNDPTSPAALNGLAFAPALNDSQYCFRYDEDAQSVERCAKGISSWIRDVAEPWFLQWKEPTALLEAENTPLSGNAKVALRDALAGNVVSDHVQHSKAMLL